MLELKDIKADKLLVDFMKELLEEGFKVYVCKDVNKTTWCKFTKGMHIGSVEVDYYGGLNFASVHKPNRYTGTGFAMAREVTQPTIEHALATFNLAPHWATDSQCSSVVKYKNWDEFAKTERILSYTEVKLNKEVLTNG